MNPRELNFGSIFFTLLFGVISLANPITMLAATLVILEAIALLGSAIQAVAVLKTIFLIFGAGFVFNLLPLRPVNAYYFSLLSMPIRAFNNLIESVLINRIGLNNLPLLETFLCMQYSLEAVIGIYGLEMLVIAPLQAALMPDIGATLETIFGTAISLYNAYKLSSWVGERLGNFNRSIIERRWMRDWREQEQLPFEDRVENARRNQQQFLPNPSQNAEQQRSFAAVWQKAIETRNLKELFERLQTQYSTSRTLHFTPEMQTAYTLNANSGDGFWQNLPAKKIEEIENANPDLCDPISLRGMRIPVRVKTATNGVVHTYDLIQLLQCLSVKAEDPLNRAPINDLRDIELDEEKYNKVRKIINNAVAAEELEKVKRELQSAPLAWMQVLESMKVKPSATQDADLKQNTSDVLKLKRRNSFYL